MWVFIDLKPTGSAMPPAPCRPCRPSGCELGTDGGFRRRRATRSSRRASHRGACSSVHVNRALRARSRRTGVAGRLIDGGERVQAEAVAIEVLSVGVRRRDLALLVEAPEEASVLAVPERVGQVGEPVARDREEARLSATACGAPRLLRRQPGQARLEHGELCRRWRGVGLQSRAKSARKPPCSSSTARGNQTSSTSRRSTTSAASASAR